MPRLFNCFVNQPKIVSGSLSCIEPYVPIGAMRTPTRSTAHTEIGASVTSKRKRARFSIGLQYALRVVPNHLIAGHVAGL